MMGTLWFTPLVAAAVLGAADDPLAAPAAALVPPPLHATSPCGSLRVTVVEGCANAAEPVGVHALVVLPGRLADWVRLPLEEAPDAIVVPDEGTMVCLDRSGRGARLVSMDLAGEERASRPLGDLVPDGHGLRSCAGLSLAYSEVGVCVAIPLQGDALALVDLDGATGLETCDVLRAGPDAETLLRRSREHLRAGDEDAARVALEEVLRIDPAEPRAYQQLARLHRRSGDQEAQLDCLREGLEQSHQVAAGAVDHGWQVGTPEARLVLEFLETTRQVRGDAEASAALGDALTLYPCMEQAVLLRADLLLADGREAEAMASLEAALEGLDGAERGPALHDIGRFLERAGRDRDALAYLTRAADAGEFTEFLIRDLADLHVRFGEPRLAAGWLSRLAAHWRSVSNGSSEAGRSARGSRRLADLEAEILGLEESVPVVTDP